MSRDRQKTRACRRPRGIHNQSIDQAGTRVQTQTGVALVFSDIFIGRCLLSIRRL